VPVVDAESAPLFEAAMNLSLRVLKRKYYKPLKRRLARWRTISYGDIQVHYKKHLDGGGTYFGQDFIPLFQRWNLPKQRRAFEWCAGPGFIGFSMLANGMCDSLCLADINPEAVESCNRTIASNGLEGKVSVFHSDNLRQIPSSERWDLVISNPPHFDDGYFEAELRAHDPGWRLHREFFTTVGRHLTESGVIVLQENNNGSTSTTFKAMIEEAGLAIVFVHNEIPTRTDEHRFYYIVIARKGAPLPKWVIDAKAQNS
jgi:tRNA1(Val) A37 N6-methylase TrmN6